MSSKLFVGGLSFSTTDTTLRAAFEPYGQLTEARVILDRESGKSRGFGFVRYTSEEAARTALEKMAGTSLDGRTIRVDLADDRPRPRRGGPGGPGGPGGGRGGPRGGPRGPRGPRGDGGGAPTYHRRGPGGSGGGPGGDRGRPSPRPRPGGDRGGWNAGGPPAEEDVGWQEARTPRRDASTKKKKKPREGEGDYRAPRSSPRNNKRQSGRSWRDWQSDDDDE